jgi:hypothetical protein
MAPRGDQLCDYEHRDVDRRARAVHALECLAVKVTVEAVA